MQGIRVFATDEPHGTEKTKALTWILLDKNKRCVAFGKEARRKAHVWQSRHQLAMQQAMGALQQEAMEPLYLFEDFKMLLQDFTHGEEPVAVAVIGPPGDPLRLPVRELVQRVYERNKVQVLKKADEDGQEPLVEVTWVLTVPAGWSDKARALIRKAAVDAGMLRDHQRPATQVGNST